MGITIPIFSRKSGKNPHFTTTYKNIITLENILSHFGFVWLRAVPKRSQFVFPWNHALVELELIECFQGLEVQQPNTDYVIALWKRRLANLTTSIMLITNSHTHISIARIEKKLKQRFAKLMKISLFMIMLVSHIILRIKR